MGDLDDVLPAIAADAMLAVGETIYYKPAGGDDREIEAVVDRNPPVTVPGTSGITPSMRITVINNSTTGIASDEVNLGGDQVKLAVRLGDTAEYRPIIALVSHDTGFVTVEVM